MKFNTKLVLLSLISGPLLTGCVTPGDDDPNAATKQGAVGGALLGLTIDALTGESDSVVKGAIAGDVAGSVVDLQSNRDNIRHDSRHDSLVNIGSESVVEKSRSWQQLENFVGEWNVSIQNHIVTIDHSEITAKGSLASLSSADIKITNEQGLMFNTSFSYGEGGGYQMQVDNQAKGISMVFVGEPRENNNRVFFYPTNVSDVIYADVPSADVRLELSFVGNQIWLIDSYAHIEGKEHKLQTFRFTRIS